MKIGYQQTFDIIIKLISEKQTTLIKLITLVGLPEDYSFATQDFIKDIKL